MMCLHGSWRRAKSSHWQDGSEPMPTRYFLPVVCEGTDHASPSKVILARAAISNALSSRISTAASPLVDLCPCPLHCRLEGRPCQQHRGQESAVFPGFLAGKSSLEDVLQRHLKGMGERYQGR